MHSLKSNFIFFLFYISFLQVLSQNSGFTNPVNIDVVPKSPQASSLGSYGDIPVNYVSGSSSYSIPLFEMNYSGISESINLTYSYAGLRIDEVPSWVGLGWSLGFGGVVTRSVRGIPDEDPNGFIGYNEVGSKLNDFLNGSMSDEELANYKKNVVDGLWDSEPDIFSFNIGNESGRFSFTPDGTVIAFPTTTIKITPFLNGSEIQKFEILDNNGTTYLFDKKEITTVENLTSDNQYSFTSSWFLSKVTSIVGEEQHYEYSPYIQTLHRSQVQSRMKISSASQSDVANGYCEDNGIVSSISMNTVETLRPTRIYSRLWELNFIPGSDRLDVIGGKTLDKIEIKNINTGAILKEVDFIYDYFGSDKYLYLKELSIDNDPSTIFQYYKETSLFPSRELNGYKYNNRDHWGYFNNSEELGNSLIPDTWYVDGGSMRNIPGVDRRPNFEASRYGALEKIQYPLGGITKFEYEAHSIGNANDLDPTVQCSGPYTDEFILENDGTDSENLTKTSTFTISHETCLSLDYYLKAVDLAFEGEGRSTVRIYSSSGYQVYIKSLTSTSDPNTIESGNDKLVLSADTYTVTVFTEVHNGVDCEARIEINYNNGDSGQSPSISTGGIRLRKITNCATSLCDVPEVRVFSYVYEDEFSNGPMLINKTSTGRLFSSPSYLYNHILKKQTQGGATSVYTDCQYKVITSYSNGPLINRKGSHVLYDMVTVYYGESGENGKTVYKYKNSGQPHESRFPFSPETFRDHKSGLLVETTHFKRTKNILKSYIPISKSINTFEINEQRKKKYIYGLKIGKSATSNFGIEDYEHSIYSNKSEWVYPKGTIDIRYNHDASDSTITFSTIEYENENHLQPTRKVSEVNRKTYLTKWRFPDDYEDSSLKTSLITANKIKDPIEVSKYLLYDGKEHLIQSSFVEYASLGLQPYKLYQLSTTSPDTAIILGNSISNPTSDYILEETYFFDSFNRLKSVIGKDGIARSIIWDSLEKYPSLEVMNASLSEIHFLSNYFSNSISWTPPNSKFYLIDYEYYNGTEWKFYDPKEYISGMSLNGSIIKNLRIYPSYTTVKSIEFDSKYNSVKEVDLNGIFKSYLYDQWNRLIEVKDNESNTLMKYQYRFLQND